MSVLYNSLLEYIKSITQEYDFDINENGALVKSEVSVYEDETKRKKTRKLLPGETGEGEIQLAQFQSKYGLRNPRHSDQ